MCHLLETLAYAQPNIFHLFLEEEDYFSPVFLGLLELRHLMWMVPVYIIEVIYQELLVLSDFSD